MTTYLFDNATTLYASEEQNNFITSTDKFIILNSCAGSGKTRCLVLKMKHLIDKEQVNCNDLIICSYTKAMTNVLRSRLLYFFDEIPTGALIGTFHSICYNLIKPLMFDNSTDNDLTSSEEILVYAYENIVNNNIDISSKYLLIDEYQDLTPMQRKIIFHLISYKKIKGVYLFGDINQTIYSFYNNITINDWITKLMNINIGELNDPVKVNELKLKKIGCIISPDQTIQKQEQMVDHFKKFTLHENYRSTNEIIKLANCFLDEKMSGIYKLKNTRPKLILFDTWTDEINNLINTLTTYVKNNYFRSIGTLVVISRYNKTLELIEDRLINKGIACNYIKYNSKIYHQGINLCTIHSAKGLEFDNVYFINSSYNVDEVDKQIYDEEKRLFYVAITRAKKRLVVSSHNGISKLLANKIEPFRIIDKRNDGSNIKDELIINTLTTKYKIHGWLGVTDLIKLLNGEHIINIKKILSPILTFKSDMVNIHKSLNCGIPKCFSNITIMSNTQNIFGNFIDALVSRHIQCAKKNQIYYQDLNRLVLLNYLNDKTDISMLTEYQMNQLKNLYHMNDSVFKSNILLDKTEYNIPRISQSFEEKLRESYLKFIDQNNQTKDILYNIFVVSLSSAVLNERLAYQYLPNYITSDDINDSSFIEWYNDIINYVSQLVEDNPTIECQKELNNNHLKIIGFSDIIIPNKLIIDVKTSILECPKLDYLLQIIIYGLLSQTQINKYQVYNPIYGSLYKWEYFDNMINKKYINDIKNKLIDYISAIIPELHNRRHYTL
jgi:DNA helicase-2/ATP-dependent DNA helicase PcrA